MVACSRAEIAETLKTRLELYEAAGLRVPVRVETLELLRETQIGDCQRCKLCKTRKKIVFGSGNPQANLVFVGEAPGADEDEQGQPFVGRAGKLLTKMIEAMGLTEIGR